MRYDKGSNGDSGVLLELSTGLTLIANPYMERWHGRVDELQAPCGPLLAREAALVSDAPTRMGGAVARRPQPRAADGRQQEEEPRWVSETERQGPWGCGGRGGWRRRTLENDPGAIQGRACGVRMYHLDIRFKRCCSAHSVSCLDQSQSPRQKKGRAVRGRRGLDQHGLWGRHIKGMDALLMEVEVQYEEQMKEKSGRREQGSREFMIRNTPISSIDPDQINNPGSPVPPAFQLLIEPFPALVTDVAWPLSWGEGQQLD
ncbi:hypothetical protein P4O66_009119 [Electrophorus voltai]|uniref:Uncharacterized protein n=1 Tax=Electrophorus voltai TaxID=2609070 RepID=A0AAD8ZAE7_9TELE|nr:hypothetical protein P4O66_009119 [Electrophorus voltai]